MIQLTVSTTRTMTCDPVQRCDGRHTLSSRLITGGRLMLVLGSASGTRDRTYIRQGTVQVLMPISKSGVWPLLPIMPEHPVA
jgi:hypothetical protein